MDGERLNFEIKRKIFHLLSLSIPSSYFFAEKGTMVVFLFLAASSVLFLDIYRRFDLRIKGITDKLFSGLMRTEEKNGTPALSGASFLFWGLFLSAYFFPKEEALSSWFVFIISDACAALAGVAFGKTYVVSGKTLEGFFAFFLSSLAVGFLLYFFYGFGADPFAIIIASFLIALAELYSKKIALDDNLVLPSAYCFLINIFKGFP